MNSTAQNQTTVIATHDGVFQPDEIFAICVLVEILQQQNRTWSVVRTRNQEVLATAQYLVDIGNQHDGVSRFDHHQSGGAGKRDDGSPYASFGLVWNAMGADYIRSIVQIELSDDQVAKIKNALDSDLVTQVDRWDYGKQDDRLADLVSALNDYEVLGEQNPPDSLFEKAFQHCQVSLAAATRKVAASIVGEKLVQDALLEDASVLVLPAFVPHKQVQTLVPASSRFVVYPSQGSWKVQGLNGCLIPESWRGRGATNLGNPDLIFVHAAGFIAGLKNKDAAVAFAKAAVAFVNSQD